MNDVRGEKVVFGKGDLPPLEAMPSTACDEAIVLATPRRRSLFRRLAKLCAVLVALTVVVTTILFWTLENGYFDESLTAQAERSLDQALSDDFEADVGSVRMRFLDNWMLGLEARNVRILHKPSGRLALKSDSVRSVLDPLALARGRVVIAIAEIGTAESDLRFLPQRPSFDWSKIRVDSVPGWLDQIYPQLDLITASLARAATERVKAGTLIVHLPGADDQPLVLTGTSFAGTDRSKYTIDTNLTLGTIAPHLRFSATRADGKVSGFTVAIQNFRTERMMLKYSEVTGEARYGLDATGSLELQGARDKALVARAAFDNGTFWADGDKQPVSRFRAMAAYDFKRGKFEISDGMADFGQTTVPFEGGVIDLDRAGRAGEAGPGFAFELVANDGVANAANAGEKPERFNAGASGFYKPAERELQLDTLSVATPSGTFTSFLNARFEEPSPAVVYTARSKKISVTSIKQLWPFWFGKKAREWILENIRGGTVTDAAIDVSLQAGRIPEYPEPLVMEPGELKISFDASGTNVRFLKDLPAAQKVGGHFDMNGSAIKIDFDGGSLPLASGKVLTAGNGTFAIADVARKPVMANVAFTVSGSADAAAEIATHPAFLKATKLPFAPQDLSGSVKGEVKAEFGLEKEQDPPAPKWAVALDLDNVDLAKPFDGRVIRNVSGLLDIDPSVAQLSGRARIDGVDFSLAVTEPIGTGQEGRRSWQVKGTLGTEDISKYVPELVDFVDGPVGVALKRNADGVQAAELDLTRAAVTIPYADWRKGAGIGAKASFTIAPNGKQSKISDFVLSGDAFGARGNLVVDGKGLVSGSFSRVQLSGSDNFSLSLQRKSGGNIITISGKALDARPYLEQIKSPARESAKYSQPSNNVIRVNVGTLTGYNKQSLGNVKMALSTSDGHISTIDFSAITLSGQAIVINKPSPEGAMTITSGDAGSVARFADLYRNMNGGLLNIMLKPRAGDAWQGNIDLRNFSLINEARLKSIVSARTGKQGKSLEEAVRADIDTSSQKFRRGFARLLLDGPKIRVENGVVRGDQLGATFQGTVRDARGRMDLTGTFMPAYGLNRLFGELPLIGYILGNGRDRGLIGITFKLEGSFEQPKLTVNPLSLIAPGVFRNIFEFE